MIRRPPGEWRDARNADNRRPRRPSQQARKRQAISRGSVTLRLPWIHLGSIALSHGLLVGNRHATIRTPWPLALTWRLWAAIQLRTSRLLCQLALSQINSRAFLPRALSLWQHHSRNRVVMELTGRPSTNLIQVPASSGRYSP